MSEIVRVKPVRIHWNQETCTDCMSCMVVCSERHLGMSAPSRARIRVHVDLLGGGHTADYCRQCGKAPCATVCPEEAIQFDEQLRAWLVDEDLCTGCGLCLDACPFDAIWLEQGMEQAEKCDLCLGAVWCVNVCPAGALTVVGMAEEVGR